MNSVPEIVGVAYLGGYTLRLTFKDGKVGDIDLTSTLWGEVFEPLRDQALFAAVRVEDGTIVWPNGADLDPCSLHDHVTPAATPA